MPTTNKRIKGGLPTLVLSATISDAVPTVGGSIVTTGTATAWPDGTGSRSFVIVIENEAILCSARAGNSLTVEQRGYDGTTAIAHTAGAVVSGGVVDAATLQAHEDHVVDTTDAHGASAVTFTPAGTIGSTNVQNAIVEVSGDVATETARAEAAEAAETARAEAAEAALVVYGTKAYAQATSDQGSIGGTVVDLTSLTVTFTALAGRRYRISARVNPQSTAANDAAVVYITDGSGVQITKAATPANPVAGQQMGLTCEVIVVPGAGSVTYKLRMSRYDGTFSGTVTNKASANQPSFLLAEDIGT